MSIDWVPFAAGPLGGVVGATVTWLATRPRLGVVVDRISIAPSNYATVTPIKVDRDLMVAIEELPILFPEITGVSAPESTYVNYLELIRQMFRDRKANFVVASQASEDLRQLAATEDYTTLIARYRSQQSSLYWWAEGEIRRGGSVFSRTQAPSGTSIHPIYRVKEGFLVQLQGTLNLTFLTNLERAEHAVNESLGLAERAATAFSIYDKQDLMDFFVAIRKAIDFTVSEMTKIETRIDSELARFARLEIDFMVSNTGRTGVSIGSDARAEIHLQGYVPGTSGSRDDAVRDDIRVDFKIVSDDKVEDLRIAARERKRTDIRVDEASPIVVQPGETKRLLGVSSPLLNEMERPDAIRSSYEAAEREVTLTVTRFQQSFTWGSSRATSYSKIRSRKILFRDLRALALNSD